MARAQLVSQRQAVANNIRGLLKTFGFVIARGSKGPFWRGGFEKSLLTMNAGGND